MHDIIRLYQGETAWGNPGCRSLLLLFPPLKKEELKTPPSFLDVVGNHTSCVRRQGSDQSRFLGDLKSCSEIESVSETEWGGNYSALKILRADLWWYCGGKILRPTMPSDWRGTCAIVQLAIPFTLAFERGEIPELKKRRRARSVFATSFDDDIYLDLIGVPRWVPDEFKARNQIAAGFESLFWWVTINKNVDWINYIYYNQHRFINYT
ncbi:uncharacterized protein LOC122553244 [Chiloscyllium plagiosum]|uniref:uncharacterized protein LOC122553244 n=1 Tax=Chiloscyllium plagiosum TaxID=36176 RepID=UPI001CB8200C|nr:uncharacterized protein LOC122553244 [Chiloscyllium plagiosum]